MLENYIEILVVDDNPNILEAMATYLTNENGFDATLVDDGSVALKFLQIKEFDVVVTDISMPITNGMELIKELRKFNKNTPVIAMSEKDLKTNSEELLEFVSYLANTTLQKPFTEKQLIETLENILNTRITTVMKLF